MGRRPEDQHPQVFFDAMEMVLDTRRYEHETARLDRPVLTRHSNRASAADHVVRLIFQVRSLAIVRCLRPDRKADAQLVRSEEIDVAMTVGIAWLRVELRNLVRIHGSLNSSCYELN